MKKQPLDKKLMAAKWLILLLVSVIMVVFVRQVKQTTLTESAIIIGIGIDYADKKFEISAQTIVPSGSAASDSSASVNYITYTEKAPTIAEAIDLIGQRIGLILSLAHCNVVFISDAALKLNHLELFYPLTHTLNMPELAVLVTGDKPPRDLLSTRIATTVTTSLFLQSNFLQEQASDGIVRLTIKDFVVGSTSRSQAVAIPYIESVEMPVQPMNDKGQLQNNYEFKIDRLLVANDSKTLLLDKELSKAAAIFLSQDVNGMLDVTLDSGESVEFLVLGKKLKMKTDENRKVTAEMAISVSFVDAQNVSEDEYPLSDDSETVLKAAKKLGDDLAASISACYDASRGSDIDFLMLQDTVYRKIGRNLEKDCLDTISFEPTVKIKVKETS